VPTPAHPRIRIHRAASPAARSADVLGALGISQGELDRMTDALAPATGPANGSIVLPGWPEYDLDRQGNPLYPARPAIIVKCLTAAGVKLALGWAHDHDWWVTVRSGGHSTAGFSLNDGMVLDIAGLDAVTIDPVGRRARVGAGANWGQVNAALDTAGLHVPGGGCPTVGVGGFVQGGGYGFTSREFGMSCDNVLEATVMLQDGSVVTATPAKNRELLWAVLGGTGGNFGVLLDVVYQLVPLGQLWGFGLTWPIEEGAQALAAIQAGFMGTAGDTKVSYQLAISTLAAGRSVVMMGMYDGTRADGMQAVAGLMGTGSPALVYDRMASYADLNENLIGILPGVPQAPGQTTYEIKRAGYISTSLAAGDWQVVLDYFATSPNDYNIVGIEPYGGAISKPSRANAFGHRDAQMDFFVDSFFSETWDANGRDSAQRWVDGFLAAMAPYLNGEVYQNYPWRGLADYPAAYWGAATYDQLRKVKAAVDPGSFFHFEQGIVPAEDGPGGIAIEPDGD
jgi:FAD/FMN-containing dehydrogenase